MGGHSFGMHDLIMVFRTIILYSLGLFVMRLMGKRSVGQLSPFDFLIAVIIGSAIAIPMEHEKIPLLHGVIPIITILFVNYLLCWLIKKSRTVEDILQGKSTVLIEDGKVLIENLKRERITLADLLILLRDKDVEQVDEIKEAVIEPNGKLSIIKKRESRNVTLKDLKIVPEPTPATKVALGIKEARQKYNVNLNLVIDAIALGLDDEETAQISKSSVEAIEEIRSQLGQINKRIGLTVTEKKAYMDHTR